MPGGRRTQYQISAMVESESSLIAILDVPVLRAEIDFEVPLNFEARHGIAGVNALGHSLIDEGVVGVGSMGDTGIVGQNLCISKDGSARGLVVNQEDRVAEFRG
jgi:hypothetical protein